MRHFIHSLRWADARPMPPWHAVHIWLGNSQKVAADHALMATAAADARQRRHTAVDGKEDSQIPAAKWHIRQHPAQNPAHPWLTLGRSCLPLVVKLPPEAAAFLLPIARWLRTRPGGHRSKWLP